MKKNDIATTLGLVAAVVFFLFGILSNAGFAGLVNFIDIPSFFIVIGGTTGALLTAFTLPELKNLFKVVKQAFSQHEQDLEGLIKIFVNLSDRARREGLLALEAEMENVDDEFIKKGVLLAVDGIEPDVINDIMSAEITAMEDRHKIGRAIVEKAGELAPAWGMIGTLVGLILMLKNLNDPSTLGPSMAIAIITTLYGSLVANVICIPLASKLAARTEKEVFLKQIVIEGVIGVQSGQNPKILEEKLSAFLPANARQKDDDDAEEETANEA
ncbi:flagellar motor protein MotP [Calidifontibacillus oryziterrae]|uniref:flagellar motor protein MotP n=1 Tax=Calidifontibacillus oryziterrae TaxID=1191699 RepID=UPI000319FB44|nr:flagellar motor protein MotP [Calidifontibacillus oryziterrae]